MSSLTKSSPPKPGFVLTCWAGDVTLAARTLESLSTHAPGSQVVLVLDGEVTRAPLEQTGWDLDLTVVQGESLSGAEHGGAWSHRYMAQALERLSSAVEVIIKLDPDVWISRPLGALPQADIFGAMEYRPSGYMVHGGCRGHSRGALERIVSSGLLLSPSLRQHGYARFGALRHPHETEFEKSYQAEDAYMIEVYRRLKLRLAPWEDVQVRFRPAFPLEQVDSSFAVWHPVL